MKEEDGTYAFSLKRFLASLSRWSLLVGARAAFPIARDRLHGECFVVFRVSTAFFLYLRAVSVFLFHTEKMTDSFSFSFSFSFSLSSFETGADETDNFPSQ